MTNLRTLRLTTTFALVTCAAFLAACADSAGPDGPAATDESAAAVSTQVAFPTPEDAVQAFSDVIGTGDMARANEIFGADGVELLRSGDDVADKNAFARVKAEILEKVAFEDGDDGAKIASFGNEGWPFPVPLVQADGGWKFDVAAGWEEIQNRRVGRNELLTLATLHEFVEAQREYAAVGRDGLAPAFAQKLFSSEGKHDGLYWPTAEGETPSPMGPQVAAAAAEGYRKSDDGPIPFHGYKYRLITEQGPAAPGGAKVYLDTNGRLTGGFAIIAWPVEYRSSGVMTFIVSHRGLVFQRDLGDDTEAAAAKITTFDPDSDWDPARDE